LTNRSIDDKLIVRFIVYRPICFEAYILTSGQIYHIFMVLLGDLANFSDHKYKLRL